MSKSEIQDQSVINELISPIKEKVKHVTADAAYDNNPTYKIINKKFSSADIVIPQQKDARENRLNEFYRNRNILEIKFHGRIGWQKNRDYGKRNISELAIQH